MRDASPLRYPGGKWRVAPYFERILQANDLNGCHYVEPYAGGASLALSLLIQRRVAEIHLNDIDPAIYSFWDSVLRHTEEFAAHVQAVKVTPDEWRRQRTVYQK